MTAEQTHTQIRNDAYTVANVANGVNVAVLRVVDAWEQCVQHLHHLESAVKALQPHLPVTADYLSQQTDDQVRIWDQFILRFSKLQDALGTRSYPALLDYLQEPTATLPMIDKLNRLEQLNLIPSASDWGTLRTLRNLFAHDYPQANALKAAYLNQALDAIATLQKAMVRGLEFMQRRSLMV